MNKFAICPEIIHCIWRSHIWAFVVLKGSILQRYRLFPGRSCCHFWLELFCQLLLQCTTASSYQQLNIPLESGKNIWKLFISFDGIHNRKSKTSLLLRNRGFFSLSNFGVDGGSLKLHLDSDFSPWLYCKAPSLVLQHVSYAFQFPKGCHSWCGPDGYFIAMSLFCTCVGQLRCH